MTDYLSNNDLARKLRQHIRYDAASGMIFWRRREREFFDCKSRANAWNAKHENQPALDNVYKCGNVGGMFFGTRLWACDVVWLFERGSLPHGKIHHRDGRLWNNAARNLRIIEPQVIGSLNLIGVVWNGYFKKWEAILVLPNNTGRKYLGYFSDPNDAYLAYDTAASKHWGNEAVLNCEGEYL